METYYYEAYNRSNVKLIDLLETPITRITEDGVITSAEVYDLDILVYATGFAASTTSQAGLEKSAKADHIIVTGAFDAIDFRGTGNISLKEEWQHGPRTYLGLTVEHFPNMFMSMGPHQAYGNIPRSIEYAVGWIAECIGYCEKRRIDYFEANNQGVRDSLHRSAG